MIYKSIYVLLYLLAVTIIMFIEKIRVGLFTVGDTRMQSGLKSFLRNIRNLFIIDKHVS